MVVRTAGTAVCGIVSLVCVCIAIYGVCFGLGLWASVISEKECKEVARKTLCYVAGLPMLGMTVLTSAIGLLLVPLAAIYMCMYTIMHIWILASRAGYSDV